jgi:hypothetical protein
MAKETYALVLDAASGGVGATYELERGTKTRVTKAHKTWLSRIKRSDWITIPEALPVSLRTNTVVSLRAVLLTPEQLKVEEIKKRWAGDPRRAAYMEQFLNGTRNFDQQFEQEGPDLLDQGFKR